MRVRWFGDGPRVFLGNQLYGSVFPDCCIWSPPVWKLVDNPAFGA